MPTHDYVIDNQSAVAFRADLNNALAAIVTQNSNATAPTTTYANMFWYDTATNILKKRNEANSAWINLGTIDEAAGTFTPTGGTVTIATQAEAEAGTDNTKMMTPLRTAQAIDALSGVTTAQVGTAYAGLAALAVGSYVAAWNTTDTAVAIGGTIAGSSLRYASVNAATTVAADPFGAVAQSGSGFPTTNTATLTGTWRAMTIGGGRLTTGTARNRIYRWNVSLWLRTA